MCWPTASAMVDFPAPCNPVNRTTSRSGAGFTAQYVLTCRIQGGRCSHCRRKQRFRSLDWRSSTDPPETTGQLGCHGVCTDPSHHRTCRRVVGPLGCQGEGRAASMLNSRTRVCWLVSGSAVSSQRVAAGSIPNSRAALRRTHRVSHRLFGHYAVTRVITRGLAK